MNNTDQLTQTETDILAIEFEKAVSYGIKNIPQSNCTYDEIQFIWTASRFRVEGLLFLSLIFDRETHQITYLMEHKLLSSECTELEFYRLILATELSGYDTKIKATGLMN